MFSIVLQDFDGIAPARVLKHCSTRWLSLERALNRLLLLWPALFAYFNREIDNSDQDRVRRVENAMSKVETKLFCHFALKPLNKFNVASKLQQVRSVHCNMMCEIFYDVFCRTTSNQSF